MGTSQLFPLLCVVAALFIVAPEPARDSPTKLADPVAAPKTPAAKVVSTLPSR
jgi:hypothetical protein